ncbi:hypothetical protein CW745_06465 [Psychromonas sp. psych-6C06]|uniref:glycosyltransferase n=1 Tax=Psychromonas sp. psych-6C06 TaxID=2058089 RepID=UPI000C32A997|nr:glycosyltransferase [Psychromonas sp. psych-6C06]PKF63058.1 hypothetical protein CW745_06465 [Psychromonas sp. psych-6C06]
MYLSIITVAYNDLIGIKKTYQSVVNFSKKYTGKLEYIIVDGGSTDGTKQFLEGIVENLEMPSITCISESDEGIYDAMNKGINLTSVSSDYILFLNSSDVFLDSAGTDLSRIQLSAVANVFSLLSSDINSNKVRVRKLTHTSEIANRPAYPHQSTFISTSYHKRNLYSKKYKILADYDFFCNLYVKKESIQCFDIDISNFMQGGISNNKDGQAVWITELKSIQLEYFNKYNRLLIFTTVLKGIIYKLPFSKQIEYALRLLIR